MFLVNASLLCSHLLAGNISSFLSEGWGPTLQHRFETIIWNSALHWLWVAIVKMPRISWKSSQWQERNVINFIVFDRPGVEHAGLEFNLECCSDSHYYRDLIQLWLQLLANVHNPLNYSLSLSPLCTAFPSSIFTHEWLTEKQKRKIVFCIFSVFVKIRSENFIPSVTSLHFLSGQFRLLHLYQGMDCCFVEICRQQQRIQVESGSYSLRSVCSVCFNLSF